MPYLRRKRNLRIERPESRIGAIVTGLDVNRLAADEWRALYDAWLAHNVRTHSETGRKALYVNPIHIGRIVGWPEAESAALIDELLSYMLQPGAEYRHKWEPGDLVIWDNRCSIHCATGGYPLNERRVHWRANIMEDRAEARSSLDRAA
jgi:alpha-ketoglutarate-dependent taurine dioxygenase